VGLMVFLIHCLNWKIEHVQTCLVGPWEGMLAANWLHLCHYPIHCPA